MAENYFGNMYNDFFGPGSGGDGKPPVFDDPDKEKEIQKKVNEDFQKTKENLHKTVDDYKKELEKKVGEISKTFGDAKDLLNGAGNANTDGTMDNSERRASADEALREAKALFENANRPKAPLPTQTATGEQAPQQEEKPAEPETDPMEDLNALIGLSSIKHDVKELTDFAKVQKLRKDEGMKSVPVSLHLVFTGNPGTGKTTVARIISRIYKQIGVLSKGQLVEVDRSGLVAGYVGQTALKTQDKINKALGGVLFIDEAYSLSQENDAFGQEAIDTILKAMEDHRDDLVVIVAGYTEPMEKFINSNPGLKSRFNKYIEFPDYSVDELLEIFNMNLKKYEYVLEEDAKKHVRELISQRKLSRIENFANAREVRNLFEEIVTNQARRIAGIENPTPDDIRLITCEDLMEKKPDESKDNGDAKEDDKANAENKADIEVKNEDGAETENKEDAKVKNDAGAESENKADTESDDEVDA